MHTHTHTHTDTHSLLQRKSWSAILTPVAGCGWDFSFSSPALLSLVRVLPVSKCSGEVDNTTCCCETHCQKVFTPLAAPTLNRWIENSKVWRSEISPFFLYLDFYVLIKKKNYKLSNKTHFVEPICWFYFGLVSWLGETQLLTAIWSINSPL